MPSPFGTVPNSVLHESPAARRLPQPVSLKAAVQEGPPGPPSGSLEQAATAVFPSLLQKIKQLFAGSVKQLLQPAIGVGVELGVGVDRLQSLRYCSLRQIKSSVVT